MLIASSVTMLVNVLHVYSDIMLIQLPIFVYKNQPALFLIASVALKLVEQSVWLAINTSFFQQILLHVLHLLLALVERYSMERPVHALKESMILDQPVLIVL